MIFAVLVIGILSVSLLFSLRNNKDLVHAKNSLILKNDSLRIMQIQSRKEIAGMKMYMDSILSSEDEKVISTK